MIQKILNLDTQLFVFLNHLPHNLILDSFLGFVTLIGYLGAIWLVISLILTASDKKRFKNLLVAILSAEVIYLFLVEFVIKNWIARLRPKFAVPDTILPFDFFQSFSFPSGHATIAFAAAYILGRGHRQLKWFYYFLAILISFSRVYLGKHYPSDVIFGGLLGMVIGYFSIRVVKNF